MPKTGGAGWAFEKFNRRAQDWAIVGVAAVGGDDPGVAVVNMGSTPVRAARGRGRAARAARRPTTPPRSPATAPIRRPTSMRRPSTAATWHGCSSARARRPSPPPAARRTMTPLPPRSAPARSSASGPAGRGPDLPPGEGTYVDDLAVDGVLHLAFVRSPIAHAEIRSIDATTRARCPASSPCSPPPTSASADHRA